MTTPQNSPGNSTLVTLNRVGVVLLFIAYFVAAYFLTGKINHAFLHTLAVVFSSLAIMFGFKGDKPTAFQAFPLLLGLIPGVSFIAVGLFEPTMLSMWTLPFILSSFAMFYVPTRGRTAKDIGV